MVPPEHLDLPNILITLPLEEVNLLEQLLLVVLELPHRGAPALPGSAEHVPTKVTLATSRSCRSTFGCLTIKKEKNAEYEVGADTPRKDLPHEPDSFPA